MILILVFPVLREIKLLFILNIICYPPVKQIFLYIYIAFNNSVAIGRCIYYIYNNYYSNRVLKHFYNTLLIKLRDIQMEIYKLKYTFYSYVKISPEGTKRRRIKQNIFQKWKSFRMVLRLSCMKISPYCNANDTINQYVAVTSILMNN